MALLVLFLNLASAGAALAAAWYWSRSARVDIPGIHIAANSGFNPAGPAVTALREAAEMSAQGARFAAAAAVLQAVSLLISHYIP